MWARYVMIGYMIIHVIRHVSHSYTVPPYSPSPKRVLRVRPILA